MAIKKNISKFKTDKDTGIKKNQLINIKPMYAFIDDDDCFPIDKLKIIISWNLIIFILGIISLIVGSIIFGLYGHALIAILLAIYGIPLIYTYDNDTFVP
jgi:hypothetical protein